MMREHGIPDQVVYEIGRQAETREVAFRALRPTGALVIPYLFLLADPKQRGERGAAIRRDLRKARTEVERRGACILELGTGRCSREPAERDAMYDDAVEALASGRMPADANSGRGRPAKVFTEIDVEKARAAWESRKLKTWAQVRDALPPGFSTSRAWSMFGPRESD